MVWRLFIGKQPPPFPSKYLIHDIQVFEVEKEYALQGESEGWLTYTGYYQLNDVMYYTYDWNP